MIYISHDWLLGVQAQLVGKNEYILTIILLSAAISTLVVSAMVIYQKYKHFQQELDKKSTPFLMCFSINFIFNLASLVSGCL